MTRTFYDMLDELENIGSHIDIEDHLVYILTHVKNAERYFRLTFNDTVYGLAEKSFYNAYERYLNTKLHEGQYEHVSDFVYEMNKDRRKSGTMIPDLESFAKTTAYQSGDYQLDKLFQFFTSLEAQKAKWFCRALLHDLRCGVQVKTINKAFRRVGLSQIKKFSMQLCAKNVDLYDPDNKQVKKITFPCSMECKEDGIRLQAEIASYPVNNQMATSVKLTSRRGKDRTDLHPEICEDLAKTFKGMNLILDGEITAKSFQALTRKDDASKRVYVVFDLLNDENEKYSTRWNTLVNLFTEKGITDWYDNKFINIKDNHIKLVEHYTARNLSDLQEYYEDLNRRGEEGMIIKLEDRPYERNSRKNMFKVKKVFDADLEIIGFNYGEGKRAGHVGSLKLIDASGTVNVDVGSGLSDYDVEELTRQLKPLKDELEDMSHLNRPYTVPEFIGKICEIQYNELSMNKDGEMSIRFPRFICIREDKDEADDLSSEALRK